MSEFLNDTPSPFEGEFPDGHPVRTYLEENLLIRTLIEALESVDLSKNFELFRERFNKLGKVELHFARKENQLFPYLEKHGWTSPSQNMWTFHDQIREEIKETRNAIEANDVEAVSVPSRRLFRSLEHIMQVEEGRLLPNAMQLLTEEEWKEFKEGDREIVAGVR